MHFSYSVIFLPSSIFEKLRAQPCLPRQEEVKAISFSYLCGWNRKVWSELLKLLSSIFLSSGVDLTSHNHPRTHRSKMKLLVPFWCCDVGEGRFWFRRCHGRGEKRVACEMVRESSGTLRTYRLKIKGPDLTVLKAMVHIAPPNFIILKYS